MTRTLTANAETASLAPQKIVVLFVELDCEDGFVRISSADRELTFSSMTFTGIGHLGKIAPFGEPTDLSVQGVTLEVTGIPSTYIDKAMSQKIQGRRARIWLGFLDTSTWALIDAPVLIYRGRMDVMDVQLGESATVTVRIENRFADWDRPRIRRYTHSDQIARFPADKGLEFVTQTTEREIVWGRG